MPSSQGACYNEAAPKCLWHNVWFLTVGYNDSITSARIIEDLDNHQKDNCVIIIVPKRYVSLGIKSTLDTH